MPWPTLNWLRENFLNESPQEYWLAPGALEAYDLSFAQRIGWKWEAVLRELAARMWAPPGETLLDWGCGTGIASRTFLKAWPQTKAYIFDKSKLAMGFALKQIPGAEVFEKNMPPPKTLLLSHVLSELTEADLESVLELATEAQSVIWVEPGTPSMSEKLVRIRQRLSETFRIVAPCPHQLSCGLLEASAQHWCHNFAQPPSHIFQQAHWKKFSQELGIDLRSLPVSFLALDKNWKPSPATEKRMLGRPRHYKGYCDWVECSETEVKSVRLLKRNNPQLYRQLKKAPFCRTYRAPEESSAWQSP